MECPITRNDNNKKKEKANFKSKEMKDKHIKSAVTSINSYYGKIFRRIKEGSKHHYNNKKVN